MISSTEKYEKECKFGTWVSGFWSIELIYILITNSLKFQFTYYIKKTTLYYWFILDLWLLSFHQIHKIVVMRNSSDLDAENSPQQRNNTKALAIVEYLINIIQCFNTHARSSKKSSLAHWKKHVLKTKLSHII